MRSEMRTLHCQPLVYFIIISNRWLTSFTSNLGAIVVVYQRYPRTALIRMDRAALRGKLIAQAYKG